MHKTIKGNILMKELNSQKKSVFEFGDKLITPNNIMIINDKPRCYQNNC